MRAESVVSTAVAGSRQQPDDPLPYYVPGVGAWPGVVIAVPPPDGRSAVTLMWRYTADGPTGKVPSMRPVAALCRLPIDCADLLLLALSEEPAPWPTLAGDRQRLFKHLGEQIRNGGPEEVAQVWCSLAHHGRRKKLTLMEREMRDRAALICRSVLDCLPDSPEKLRALEILDDRKPPACP